LFEDTLRKLDTAINAANQSGVDRNELIDILWIIIMIIRFMRQSFTMWIW